MGIEPTPSAWKAEVLPLNYTRATDQANSDLLCRTFVRCVLMQTRQNPVSWWWRGKDSNLRRLSQQIYSLPPLTAREPLQN